MAMGGIAVPDSKLYAVSANLGAYRGEEPSPAVPRFG